MMRLRPSLSGDDDKEGRTDGTRAVRRDPSSAGDAPSPEKSLIERPV